MTVCDAYSQVFLDVCDSFDIVMFVAFVHESQLSPPPLYVSENVNLKYLLSQGKSFFVNSEGPQMMLQSRRM